MQNIHVKKHTISLGYKDPCSDPLRSASLQVLMTTVKSRNKNNDKNKRPQLAKKLRIIPI